MSIQISTLALGKMDNFIYIINNTETKTAMVIDPAWDFVAIQQCLTELQTTLTGVLLTHSHYDHIDALDDIITTYNVPVYMSEAEFSIGNIRADRLPQGYYAMSDNDTITLGNKQIQVIATSGHTVGSLCYKIDNTLFTGDTFFIDGCGRCNFSESNIDAMWESLQKLKKLPDNTVIYPGHHYGLTTTDTIGNQKKTNPYFIIDDKEFFIEFRQHLQGKYRSIPFAPSSNEEMRAIQNKEQR